LFVENKQYMLGQIKILYSTQTGNSKENDNHKKIPCIDNSGQTNK